MASATASGKSTNNNNVLKEPSDGSAPDSKGNPTDPSSPSFLGWFGGFDNLQIEMGSKSVPMLTEIGISGVGVGVGSTTFGASTTAEGDGVGVGFATTFLTIGFLTTGFLAIGFLTTDLAAGFLGAEKRRGWNY